MKESILSERLWKTVAPLIPQPKNRHKQYAGRKPSDPRRILTGIVFVLTTGVPWRVLPATEAFPSGHTCRRWLLKWQRSGVWNKLSTILLAELRKENRLHLEHVVVDSSSVRAPGGGSETGPNPTDRAKRGTKHHVLTDAKGTPLVAIITGANRNDQTQIMPLVEHMPSIGGKQGRPKRKPKKLYADRGYDSEPHRRQLKKRHNTIYSKT